MGFEEITTLQTALDKKISEEGQRILKEEFDKVFAAVPRLTGIYWTQYTPFFNDGDTCEFNVYDFHFEVDGYEIRWSETYAAQHSYVKAGEKVSGECTEDRPNYYYDFYVHPKQVEDTDFDVTNPITEAEYKALTELETSCQQAENAMRAVFGDHAEITATREGFEVEEYEHD